MLNIRKIFYAVFVLACCISLFSGCNKEAGFGKEERNVNVLMNVGTRAGEEPTDSEKKINSLKVYAFSGSELIGYQENMNYAGNAFLMDLKMLTTGIQYVDFYLIANEAEAVGMTPLSETTSRGDLDNRTFTSLGTSGVLPLVLKQENVEIDMSTVGTTDDPDHAGHTPSGNVGDKKLNFSLIRPVGKLGIYFSRAQSVTDELKVTGVKVTSGVKTYNYLMANKEPYSPGVDAPIDLMGGKAELPVDKRVTSPEDRDMANFVDVLATTGVSFYPFENVAGCNPASDGGWNVDEEGDVKGGLVLEVSYTLGSKLGVKRIYLPPIERNSFYQVYCIVQPNAVINIVYEVADWDYDGEIVQEEAQPSTATSPVEGDTESYKGETYFVSEDSWEGAFQMQFEMTQPAGKKWIPTLSNGNDFDFRILDQNKQVVDADACVGGPDKYIIQVRPKASALIGMKTDLYISVPDLAWGGGDNRLLINENYDESKAGTACWYGGPQYITITTVDVPVSGN